MWAGLVVLFAACLPASQAGAANSPTFRDCSFIAGLDPDFVKLSGVAAGSGGTLAVSTAQSAVTVEASESSDPFDNLGHVTLSVTVSGTGTTPKTVSGMGLAQVTLSVPLSGVAVGGQYTLSWSATFDNGVHSCPSSGTPQNLSPNPFVLNVLSSSQLPPTPPTPQLAIANLRESHRVWRPAGSHHMSKKAHRRPVGTEFSFDLSQSARVRLAFVKCSPAGSGGENAHGPDRTQGAAGARAPCRAGGSRCRASADETRCASPGESADSRGYQPGITCSLSWPPTARASRPRDPFGSRSSRDDRAARAAAAGP
jgi:hypothetical protein